MEKQIDPRTNIDDTALVATGTLTAARDLRRAARACCANRGTRDHRHRDRDLRRSVEDLRASLADAAESRKLVRQSSNPASQRRLCPCDFASQFGAEALQKGEDPHR